MAKNSYFRFKQFTLHQDRCAMKVSSDACLLGAWVASQLQALHAGRVFRGLDIGTGTGLLALMVAQANPGAHLAAVEMDAAAATQAQENAQASPWSDRVVVWPLAIQAMNVPIDGRYEAIVSNPPFFNHSLKSEKGPARNLARHTDALPYPDLWAAVARLLAPTGRFYLLLPLPEAEVFAAQAGQYQFGLLEKLLIQDSPAKSPHRVVLTFGPHQQAAPSPADQLATTTLVVKQANGTYSDAFRALMGPFYE